MKKLSKSYTGVHQNKSFPILFLIFALLQGCGQNDSKSNNQQVGSKTLAVTSLYKFQSSTAGGGDMEYEIEDSGQNYKVQLNRFNFTSYQANQKTILVQKSVGPMFGFRSEGELDIIHLMSGACKFSIEKPAACNSCASGSWTDFKVFKLSATEAPTLAYGLVECSQEVDLGKVRSFIINSFYL